MGNPDNLQILELTPDLHGSVIEGPGNLFICSVFHAPTGRTLFGREDSRERAMSWLDGAKLVFAPPKGGA